MSEGKVSRRKYLKYAGAAVAAGAVAAAGYGLSQYYKPPAPTTPTPTTPTGGAKKKLKIGTTKPLTGQEAVLGRNELNGTLLWVKMVNEAGGIKAGDGNTYEVELIYYNDENKPENVGRLFEKLITEDKVDYLFGPIYGPLGMATVPVVTKYRKLEFYGTATYDPSIWREEYGDYVVHVCTNGSHYLRSMIDMIMDYIVPELDPDAAYNNFYRTLHHLRRILEPSFSPPNSAYVSFDGGIVRIIGDVVAWLDIDEFKRCLAEAKNAEVAGEADRAIVWRQAACELYRGDLMVDDLYEDWVQAKREQFREMQIGNLCKLSEHWARREKLDLAADYLRQILAIDPTREEIHLKLMTYLARAGNRTAALQQYKRCEKILKEELDAEPMPKTKAYYRKLLAGV
ncbi:MAG: BTAD domain-containing putative transcriptional regulator, partial [Candidatus Bathyarchaeia archaeon]